MVKIGGQGDNKMTKCRKCKKGATYNFEGLSAKFCKGCSEDGMVDVYHTRCQATDCKKRPTYGLVKGQAQYCKQHNKDRMPDVINKTCKECKKQPVYGKPGGRNEYCADHGIPKGLVDIMNKKCTECEKQATVGHPGGKVECCAVHGKNKGMVNFYTKVCEEDECDTFASFGLVKGRPTHCMEHCRGMRDVVSTRCKFEGCDIIPSNPRYKGYCTSCFMHVFPNEKIVCNFMMKEKTLRNALKSSLSSYNFDLNKSIKVCIDGLHLIVRPDFYFEQDTHVIIIENDEDQHNRLSYCDESDRTDAIQQTIENPLIMLRFNPDKYLGKDQAKHNSCFAVNKDDGKMYLKNEKEYQKRVDVLVKRFLYHAERIPKKVVIEERLFYNGY